MAIKHVLLLGGHGKVSQLLTPMLLKKSWDVTSIIRNPDQVAHLEQLGASSGGPGKLNVLVRSIDDVKSQSQAQAVIDEVKPDYVVWSAGAAGKGAPERFEIVDRDATCYFIRAAVATPSVTKFILISFIGCRYEKAPWLDEAHWQQYLVSTRQPYDRYYKAKIVADQELYEAGKIRKDFAAISLRPGRLTMEPVGKVSLGKIDHAEGPSSRASVAYLTALLLDSDAKSCWLDMLDGDEDPEAAVNRCIAEGVDCVEGERFVTKN